MENNNLLWNYATSFQFASQHQMTSILFIYSRPFKLRPGTILLQPHQSTRRRAHRPPHLTLQTMECKLFAHTLTNTIPLDKSYSITKPFSSYCTMVLRDRRSITRSIIGVHLPSSSQKETLSKTSNKLYRLTKTNRLILEGSFLNVY